MAQADTGQLYGIIDGHHRYQVALDTHQEEILADIVPDSDVLETDPFRDLRLAVRLNESATKMTDIEKGKVIYELIRQTGKDAPRVAMEIFGVKTSMAYHCLNAYKKSIGETVISKPRRPVDFDRERLAEACLAFHKHTSDPKNVDEYVTYLDEILTLERELRKYKKILLAQDGVRLAFDSRKSH